MLHQTLSYLDALYRNVDPATGELLPADSVFTRGRVRYAIINLRATLGESAGEITGPKMNDVELRDLCADLRTFGFSITATQLVHVLRGSRRVIDPRLRSLPVFGKYRGEFAKTQIERFCRDFIKRFPALADPAKAEKPKRTPKPWKNEPFFSREAFDQLGEEDYARLGKDIAELGLKREGEKLPEFIAKIRQRLPRSYEPWTKAERALLLEAMCYTNDGEKLGRLFGRGAKSVTEEGKRLIYFSKQQHAERS